MRLDRRRSAAGSAWGAVHISAHTDAATHLIDIDDDGPGIPPEVRTG